MNVFSLLNHFFRENEREKVSSSATKLYFFLIYEANKSYWEGPLMFSERKLSSLLSFSKNTVSKSLSELEDRGLITCYPRRVSSLTANKEDSLTANEEGSLKRPERGSRKDSLTANVEGKGAFSSTFWFPEVQLRKTASRQMRKEKKDVYNKGVRYNVHGAEGNLTANVKGKEAFSSTFWFPEVQLRETALRQTRKEKKEVYDKGVRYNVHRAESGLAANKGNSLTANEGGSKYAKFF